MLETRIQQKIIGLLVSLAIICSDLGTFAGTVTYTYDNKGQVTRSEHQDGPVIEYTYDNIGNRATMTAASSALDLTLVAFYPFSEGSGGTTADASGNGYDGDVYATWTTEGKEGNALSFDGVDDLVSTQMDLPVLSEELRVSLWINPDTSRDWGLILTNMTTATGDYNWMLWQYGGQKLRFYINTTSGGQFVETPAVLTIGQWQQIEITYDGTQVEIFHDGTMCQSGVIADPAFAPRQLAMGRTPHTAGNQFDGKIDEVRIFGQESSAAPLVALYRFNEGSGTQTRDNSDHGYDATISSATWTTGKSGNALDFDGVDDLVSTQMDLPVLSEELRVSLWINPDTSRDWGLILTNMTTATGDYNWMLWQYGGQKLRFYINTTSGGQSVETPAVLTIGQWQQIEITYDGTQVEIFHNGTICQSGVIADPAFASRQLAMGRTPHTAGNQFDGKIDEVTIFGKESSAESLVTSTSFFAGTIDEIKIYDRALSASEIQNLAGL